MAESAMQALLHPFIIYGQAIIPTCNEDVMKLIFISVKYSRRVKHWIVKFTKISVEDGTQTSIILTGTMSYLTRRLAYESLCVIMENLDYATYQVCLNGIVISSYEQVKHHFQESSDLPSETSIKRHSLSN